MLFRSITLVAPLVELGLLAADYPLTCHGLSGYSGAGKSGIAQYRDPERDIAFESPRPYGLTLDHKHLILLFTSAICFSTLA